MEKKKGKKCCLESVILGDAWKSVECCADATFEQRACVMSVRLRLKVCKKGATQKEDREEERVGMFCENTCECTLDVCAHVCEWKSRDRVP